MCCHLAEHRQQNSHHYQKSGMTELCSRNPTYFLSLKGWTRWSKEHQNATTHSKCQRCHLAKFSIGKPCRTGGEYNIAFFLCGAAHEFTEISLLSLLRLRRWADRRARDLKDGETLDRSVAFLHRDERRGRG